MCDDTNDKVIDFSKKSNLSEGNQQKSFIKEFQYVKLTKDDNGNSFKEEFLVENAKRTFYIITVVKNNGIASALYKYKVPYDALLDFLYEFKITKSNGSIIDIKRYVPEDLA